MALINQATANAHAQALMAQIQRDSWQARQHQQTQQQLTNINRRLDAIKYGWYR